MHTQHTIQWTTSVNALPAELLLSIFQIVKDACLELFYDEEWGYPMNLAWVGVASHVCRRWRDIALGSPTLWEDIDLTRPDVAEEMLKRTGSSPFRLHTRPPRVAPFSVATRDRALLAACEQLSQAKEIDLLDVGDEEIKMLTNGPLIPLPVLESLRIHTSDFFAITDVLVPFLQQEMPTLSALDLCNCAIPHPLLTFPRLVVLKLTGISECQPLITVLEALDSLKAMPHLEHVELIEAVAPLEQGDLEIAHRREAIQLPHLKFISVDNIHLDGSFIIHALRYPPTAKIHIGGSIIPDTHLPAITDICSRLRKGNVPMSSLRIMLYYESVDVYYGIGSNLDESKELFDLDLEYAHLSPTSSHFLLAICSSLPTASVTTLCIDSPILPSTWQELLQLWPNVEEVSLFELTSPFLEELSTNLPKLKRLKLESFTVTTLSSLSLIAFLRQRKANHIPIESVTLSEASELGGGTLEELKGCTTLIFK